VTSPEPSNSSDEAQVPRGSKYNTSHTSRRRRSASDRSKRTKAPQLSPPLSPPSSYPPKSKGAKHARNLIEKKYRTALNDQFTLLHRQLPQDGRESSGLGSMKGDILLRARQYIRSLEEKGQDLEEENRSLEMDVQTMKMLWTTDAKYSN